MEIIAGRTPAADEQLHERADSGRSQKTAGTVRLQQIAGRQAQRRFAGICRTVC